MTDNSIKIHLHEIDDSGRCYADITLAATGIDIEDFLVVPGLGGGVHVHMPKGMGTTWSYTYVEWPEVRRQITEEYRKVYSPKPEERTAAQTEAPQEVKEESAEKAEPLEESATRVNICAFHPVNQRTEADATATVTATGEMTHRPHIVHYRDTGTVKVYMLGEGETPYTLSVELDRLLKAVESEYKRQLMGEECSAPEGIEVSFRNVRNAQLRRVDVKLPHKMNVIKGFSIKLLDGTSMPRITAPARIGRWSDSAVSWQELCSIIRREYSMLCAMEGTYETEEAPILPETAPLPEIPTLPEAAEEAEQKAAKETNSHGRVMNADNSPFVFYPRTVLKVADRNKSGKNPPNSEHDRPQNLFYAMYNGTVGTFEISLLGWIARLRYVTTTMLLSLIEASYVSLGNRSGITVTAEKLVKIINRMSKYVLIDQSTFVSVNDDNTENAVKSQGIGKIYTLGKNGGNLLHELGKKHYKYNGFDVYQDGNTVKRFMTSNQWLIYWLKTYKEEVGENYETSFVLSLRGAVSTGARVYAMVSINGRPMIAEPVRRVEDFEKETSNRQLKDKLMRLSLLFNSPDNLYVGEDDFILPARPIIVLICEDEEHIREVHELIKPILPMLGNEETGEAQEIWFTCDKRTYNADKRGERFLRYDGDTYTFVDYKETLGIGNEAEE